MDCLKPVTAQEMAEALVSAEAARRRIRLGGAFSKDMMGGPIALDGVLITSSGLNRVLQYEHRDLTVSVEAGMPFAELSRILAGNRQMVPLDPPFGASATVGGVVAANTSGPRRRLFGTARDHIIGMKFATLEGKIVQSGGMVVKNVAGLDMAKLMTGSFGTLAAIVSVNFKLTPMPAYSRTFLRTAGTCAEAAAARDGLLRGVLQPAAVDLLNPAGARLLGRDGWLLAVQAGGNSAVVERFSREMAVAEAVEGSGEDEFWAGVREFAPGFLGKTPDGAVVRVSVTLGKVGEVLEAAPGPALARAGSGVCYACFGESAAAAAFAAQAAGRGWKAVVESSPPAKRDSLELWPDPGSDLGTMRRIKQMFDPGNLLNAGRLYGRL